MCEELAEAQPTVASAQRYGTPGQKQHGIDIIVEHHNGDISVIQCRRIQILTPANLAAAADDYLEGKWAARSVGLIVATSASAARTEVREEELKQRQRLKEHNQTFELWDQHRLSKLLRKQPDLVLRFFGADILRAFLPHEARADETQRVLDAQADATQLVLDAVKRLPIQGRAQPAAADPGAMTDDALLALTLVGGTLRPELQEVLEELRGHNATAAGQLARYIGDDLQRAVRLTRSPQPWVEQHGWEIHNALGQLAITAGEFADALGAFQRAEQVAPDKLRALMLMRARDAAKLSGDGHLADELLQRARDQDENLLSVRLVDAEAEPDAADRLHALDELTPQTDRERSAVDRARVDALISLEHLEDALAVCQQMLDRNPASMPALDRRAGLTMHMASRDVGALDAHEAGLRQAAQDSLALRDRLAGSNRAGETGAVLARAAEANVLLGNAEEARRIVGLATEAERSTRESRRLLAQALMHARQPHEALALLGDEADWDDADRQLAARALALHDDHAARVRATEVAAPLLNDPNLGPGAGFAVLVAAAEDVQLPWPDEQYDRLAAEQPVVAAHLRAERLGQEGREEEADQLLARYADDPDVLGSLAVRALDAGNIARGLAQARALVSKTGRPEDKMLLARALHEAGELAELRPLLNGLAGDPAHPVRSRSRAFAALSQAVAPGDFAQLAEISQRWIAAVPDDTEAVWQRVYALANLARHEDAYELIDRYGLEPQDEQRAYLIGAVFTRVLPPLEAARRIAALSDEFDRTDERLEALFLMTAIGTSENADEDLRARIGDSLNAFHESFPDSTILKRFTVDEDNPEGIIELLRSMTDADDEARRRKIMDDIDAGDTAVCLLAQMVGKDVGEVLLRLPLLPEAYGSPALTAVERESAQTALAAPVVWDPTSATVLGLLDMQVREAVLKAFPGSVISQSSLSQCDYAAVQISDADEELTMSLRDGEIHTAVITGAELEHKRAALRAARALAIQLGVVTDKDATQPDPLDDVIDDDPRASALNTWPTTISIARRRGLPIYSDDRYLRVLARREGLQSFGTDALLDVLLRDGRVDAALIKAARMTLLRRGAVGLRPTGVEAAVLAAETGDELHGFWPAALRDTAGWRNDPDERLRQWLRFLFEIYSRSPDRLPEWTAHVLACARQAIPGHRLEFFARVLLLYALFLGEHASTPREQRAWIAALLDALRSTPAKTKSPGFSDLVEATIQLAWNAGRKGGSQFRRWTLFRVVRQLKFPLDTEVLGRMWPYC